MDFLVPPSPGKILDTMDDLHRFHSSYRFVETQTQTFSSEHVLIFFETQTQSFWQIFESSIQILSDRILKLGLNLSDESSKYGLKEWGEIMKVAEAIHAGQWLKFRGLMVIPAPNLGEIPTRKIYAKIRGWQDKLRQALGSAEITELSMGMTADYYWAIQEGATMIRVGTAIFGSRK